MRVCSYCGRENDDVFSACSGCGTGFPDINDRTVPAEPRPKIVCPVCGAHDGYKTSIALRGSFSWVAFMLGGLIAALFHYFGRQQRVQCNACGTFFSIRTVLSKMSLAVFWLLVVPTVIVLVLIVLGILLK